MEPTVEPSKEELVAKQAKHQRFVMWLIAGIVGLMFALVLSLLIIGINLIINSAKNISSPPPPTPVIEAPTPTAVFQSKFATDAGVLKLRDDLTKLQTDIDSVDLFEPQLASPNLDLKISIQSTN